MLASRHPFPEQLNQSTNRLQWHSRQLMSKSVPTIGMVVVLAACGVSSNDTGIGAKEQDVESARGTAASSIPAMSLGTLKDDAEPSLNKLFSRAIMDGRRGDVEVEDLTLDTYTLDPDAGSDQPVPEIVSPESVVHPRLQRDIDDLASGTIADGTVNVIITFKEEFQMPRFPALDETEPRESAANQLILQQSLDLENAIIRARAPGYDAKIQDLASVHAAVERDRFWLINAVVVEVPLSQISTIASRNDIQQIEYSLSDSERPLGTVANARAIIQSDPYANITTTNAYIALLDSGVRSTHALLAGTLGFVRDCVSNTNATCSTGTDVNDLCIPRLVTVQRLRQSSPVILAAAMLRVALRLSSSTASKPGGWGSRTERKLFV